jgi:hypothetical protein
MLPRLKELKTFIQGSEIEPLQPLTGNTPCAREIRLRSKNSQLKLVTPRKFCLPQIIRLSRELEPSVKPRQSGDEMWGGDKRLKVPNFQSCWQSIGRDSFHPKPCANPAKDRHHKQFILARRHIVGAWLFRLRAQTQSLRARRLVEQSDAVPGCSSKGHKGTKGTSPTRTKAEGSQE